MAIHLLNPLWDASGGSEWRTISLFRELAPHAEVSVWTEYTPDPRLLGQVPIKEMLQLQSFPREGTFVFIGAYWEVGRWLTQARPDRVILAYNIPDPETLDYRISQLEAVTGRKVELRFASDMMARHANGRHGTVELSPIDFEVFAPGKATLRTGGRPVVVGRHSRDQTYKHHPNDPAIYKHLIGLECQVRVLGGMCLADRAAWLTRESVTMEPTPDEASVCLSVDRPISLMPANSVPAHEFLQGLDIFFYQTDPSWTEAYGRVVAEAMGCGLPCVVEAGGGYESLIRQCENGFTFKTQEEAVELLEQLVADSDLRARVGCSARKSIVDLYDAERQKTLGFYLAGP